MCAFVCLYINVSFERVYTGVLSVKSGQVTRLNGHLFHLFREVVWRLAWTRAIYYDRRETPANKIYDLETRLRFLPPNLYNK